MYCQGQRETSSQHRTGSTLEAQETAILLIFPNFKGLWFRSISHAYSSLKRTKARGFGRSSFCAGNVGHQLAKDSLSWINWKRRQKSNCFSVGRSGGWVPTWLHVQMSSCCHLLATQLKAQSLEPRARLGLTTTQAQGEPLHWFCLTFAKMISTYLDDTLVGNG